MSKTEIINEEPNIPETVPQSEEDKFFGKTTEINNTIPEGLEVEVIDDVEVVNDTPEEDRVAKKSEDNTPDVCLLYTSPSPRDGLLSRMPSSA